MKRRSAILIAAGVAIAAIISGIALYTDYRLRATEGQEHGNETAADVAQEVLTAQPSHSDANETKSNSTSSDVSKSHSEVDETPEQRAAEGH